eukprot:scaffold27473_cov118-Isochrysis_galbana.AAC.4
MRVAAFRERICRARLSESLGRVAMSSMNLAARSSRRSNRSSSRKRVMRSTATTAMPAADLVGNVGRELLIVGARQVVEKGQLACAEEDLRDAELVVGLVEPEREQEDLAEGGRVECRDGARHDVLIPVVERIIRAAGGEAFVHQPERLHHA